MSFVLTCCRNTCWMNSTHSQLFMDSHQFFLSPNPFHISKDSHTYKVMRKKFICTYKVNIGGRMQGRIWIPVSAPKSRLAFLFTLFLMRTGKKNHKVISSFLVFYFCKFTNYYFVLCSYPLV